MTTDSLIIHVRVTVNGANVPFWRVKLLGRLAKWLGVPLEVQ